MEIKPLYRYKRMKFNIIWIRLAVYFFKLNAFTLQKMTYVCQSFWAIILYYTKETNEIIFGCHS
jgi:hypothetical protein